MCILVTDESGDQATNFSDLEPTIAAARAAHCPVYILGREAVFGYPYAHLRWVDPDTKISFWLRIDRGPETPYPEQLQIDGIHRRYDAHPSGFGPYEQARLARQAGGVFFLLPSREATLWRRDDRVYDADAMRPYLPALSARRDYAAERDKLMFGNLDADRNAMFLEAINQVLAIWEGKPPYNLAGKYWNSLSRRP